MKRLGRKVRVSDHGITALWAVLVRSQVRLAEAEAAECTANDEHSEFFRSHFGAENGTVVEDELAGLGVAIGAPFLESVAYVDPW